MHQPKRSLLVAIVLTTAPAIGLSQIHLSGYAASVTDCGVVGNKSVDDTVALNNCIAQLPDYHTLQIPAGLKIKITNTINIHGKYGLRIEGLTSMYGGPSVNVDAPSIFWYGADGGKMFDIDDTSNFLIEGITLFSSSDYTPMPGGAGVGFNVDQTLGLGMITTNGIFERVAVYGTRQNPTFRGITFAPVGHDNVEHMTVRESIITCSYGAQLGQGIVIGTSGNAKKHLYTDNAITNCATGIYVGSGSADIVHNEFSTNVTHIFANTTDPMTIRDNDSEYATQFFKGQFSHGGSLVSNRIAAVSPPAGHGAVEFTGGTVAVFEGNSFDWGGDFIPISGQGGPYGAPALISRGNMYPNTAQTIAGWKTFGYHATSEMDFYGNGLAVIATKGTAAETPPTSGMGLVNYDWATQKWQVSENATGYRNLVPDTQSSNPGCSYIGRIWFDTTSSTQPVEKHCVSVDGTLTWVTIRDIQSSDPGCSYIGRIWFDTTKAAQTVERHCLSVNGKLAWVTK